MCSSDLFKIQELRQRILYTAGLLVVIRFGAHVTLPGVDAKVLAEAVRNQASNTLFGLYDLFVGGAFSNAAIFALGIMPISVHQLLFSCWARLFPISRNYQRKGKKDVKKLLN